MHRKDPIHINNQQKNPSNGNINPFVALQENNTPPMYGPTPLVNATKLWPFKERRVSEKRKR